MHFKCIIIKSIWWGIRKLYVHILYVWYFYYKKLMKEDRLYAHLHTAVPLPPVRRWDLDPAWNFHFGGGQQWKFHRHVPGRWPAGRSRAFRAPSKENEWIFLGNILSCRAIRMVPTAGEWCEWLYWKNRKWWYFQRLRWLMCGHRLDQIVLACW